METLNYLEFENHLAQYILGMKYDEEILLNGIRNFKICRYDGYIFRGLSFRHAVSKADIDEQELCSWSTNLGVAVNFAKHDRYGIVLIKKSNGISVQKLLNYLRDNDLMVSEKLQRCSSQYEEEVLDGFTILDTEFMEPI